MPSVDPNGPPWSVRTLRADWRNLRSSRGEPRPRGFFARAAATLGRLFGGPKRGLPAGSDDDPDSGAAGAGDRSPLLPPSPVRSGAAVQLVPRAHPEDVNAAVRPLPR